MFAKMILQKYLKNVFANMRALIKICDHIQVNIEGISNKSFKNKDKEIIQRIKFILYNILYYITYFIF